MWKSIIYKEKELTVHRAVSAPVFNDKTVLVNSTWDYVDLWLRRRRNKEAIFFWNQARSFFEATKTLNKSAAPLTAYYCFLNATKAYLLSLGVQFSDQHGVSGERASQKTSLEKEVVKFKTSGVLPALSRQLDDAVVNTEYTLKNIFFNLPMIHRAYDLSYKTEKEMFIPLSHPRIMTDDKKPSEACFFANINARYKSLLKYLPKGYEISFNNGESHTIRKKKRFKWDSLHEEESISRFHNYHKGLRKSIYCISGERDYWYIKIKNKKTIERKSLALIFAAMHRLSELARYEPNNLSKHFDTQHNWLISEFIETAPQQFLAEISSEITGQVFLSPGRKNIF
ncbi:YaaC family protein [Acanthopleuribacter pedis]|uniref:YaaC-like Protein n=1 Tax=Acanthopleuribacter pedis TaxID=442870 RepID=A0A8J7Q2J5_9BACT|nr:YaaC family protein [Acanthopleuribacter pedis]MBO1319372.1 hypothetical protein [Acanthopleuribacter pedis]